MGIMELAAQLGQAIKADERVAKMNEAQEAYNKDEEIQKLMLEFNTQQIALQEEYKKPELDENLVKAIEGRLDELVSQITTSQTYLNAIQAQEAMNKLMEDVYAEVEFQITGKRPCSHDCSTCGSSCGHDHH